MTGVGGIIALDMGRSGGCSGDYAWWLMHVRGWVLGEA